jgi:hypothetical protein
MQDCLPVPTGTIKSISLKIGFVNLEYWGLSFLQDVRQTSSISVPETKPQNMGFSNLSSGQLVRV